ncbi:UDP-2,4-diacetamido-2,4,6-trideoxy-beta-L-altropyranose hydrolase [Atribacter sp.]|uniref:UDP-2,4-diacetamido-2,4, 6-trideoxy-beta-L-altropyranose hydrolase n=1 Tax=Atribacter sp. TaxID=2847780 RepID=UPI002D1FBBD9|nr:UDP-2,4-diacetamido-2,4,6-trideoxy-beta-L-altropyranose hydrolase [Atribacter sp.]
MNKVPLTFVFRVDASLTIGTGHVMRCLTLGSVLLKKGNNVFFICREHEGHLCNLIEQQGFSVCRLPAPTGKEQIENTPPHALWLGLLWHIDAEQTRIAIQNLGIKPDWLIIDHYAIDHRWESALRPLVGNILVIDDLADRIHDCDLLLDQNLFDDIQTRYVGKVPTDCRLLLGPEYALLHPVYADLHDRIPPREGPVRRILISFGGTDNDNLTGLALSAVLSLGRPDIEVDVVIGEGNPYMSTISNLAEGHQNVIIHRQLPTLAILMAKADLAIGAAGATSWERLCMGLPAVVITTAENQRHIAEELERRGLIRYLGHKNEVTLQALKHAIADITNKELDYHWSIECHQTIDGKGVDRVSTVLTIKPDTPLHVRHARLSDEKLLLKWANDLINRFYSFSPKPISQEVYHRLFYQCLRDVEGCRIYLIETSNGIPIGQVRFEKKGEIWEISYSLASEYRSRGISNRLLETAIQEFRSGIRGVLVIEKVKKEDVPTQWVFESPDFTAMEGRKKFHINVCSGLSSWINGYLPCLILKWLKEGHAIQWTHDADELSQGDMCFYLSYGKIVRKEILERHTHNLVVHASNLPKGRGWSPLTWQVLESANSIPVTLFEAEEALDSGPIYLQKQIVLQGDELVDELRNLVFQATYDLCTEFIDNYPGVLNNARLQEGEASYYRRRTPDDSELDPDRSLRSQFNLLRVVDNERYPAWFTIGQKKFIIKIMRGDGK